MFSMKRLLLLFSLIVFQTISAQSFDKVDAKVSTYPRYSNVEDLAKQIQKDFTSDIYKVRAAFKWLTNNISYSLDNSYQKNRSIRFRYANEAERLQKVQEIKDKIVSDAFKNKRGVCEEYAQSLKKLCDLMQIECEVLKGNIRNSPLSIGKPETTTNHAWNIVKINNKWIIIDATWAAGYVLNNKWEKSFREYYFDIPAKLIGKTHFPVNRKWQILWSIDNKKDFYNQPIYTDAFLSKELSFSKSTPGIIQVKKGKLIELEIKGLTEKESIFYVFKNDQYAKKPQIKKSGNSLLTIPAPTTHTELYLFVNNELAVSFKVKVI